MAIRCIFYFDERAGGEPRPSCQVIKCTGLPELAPPLKQRLLEDYCRSGAFIACPLFRRVERGLVKLDRLRDDPTAFETAASSPCP
jgi:hypothetical protein